MTDDLVSFEALVVRSTSRSGSVSLATQLDDWKEVEEDRQVVLEQ